MKGLKFVETLSITLEKMTQDGTINKTAYFNSAPKSVINSGDLEEDLMFSSQEIQNKIATWKSEGSGWIIKPINGQWIKHCSTQPSERIIVYSTTIRAKKFCQRID